MAAVIGLGALPCHWLPVDVAGATASYVAATPQAEGSGEGGGLGHEIHVTLSEWSLLPADVSISVGQTVRFLATNVGVLAHSLAVEGDALYVESEVAGAGGTVSLDVAFDLPGIYDLFCPLNAGQHRALGQEGVLIVLPSSDDLAIAAEGLEAEVGETDIDHGWAAGEAENDSADDVSATDVAEWSDDDGETMRSELSAHD